MGWILRLIALLQGMLFGAVAIFLVEVSFPRAFVAIVFGIAIGWVVGRAGKTNAALPATIALGFLAIFLLAELSQARTHRFASPVAVVTVTMVSWAIAAIWSVFTTRLKILFWPFTVGVLSWLVAYFSGIAGSSVEMVDFLVAQFGMTREAALSATPYLRKAIHFVFYGMVAVAGYGTARVAERSILTAGGFGILTCSLIAIFDESRQSGLKARTGTAYDVLLDITGGLVFLLIVSWIESHRRRVA